MSTRKIRVTMTQTTVTDVEFEFTATDLARHGIPFDMDVLEEGGYDEALFTMIDKVKEPVGYSVTDRIFEFESA